MDEADLCGKADFVSREDIDEDGELGDHGVLLDHIVLRRATNGANLIQFVELRTSIKIRQDGCRALVGAGTFSSGFSRTSEAS